MEDEVHHGDPHHLARYISAVDRGFEQVPVGNLLAGPLLVRLELRNFLLGLIECLPALFEPDLAVNRHLLGLLAVASEDVIYHVDEKPRRSTSRVVHSVAEIGIDHLDHKGADLARRPKLTVQRRLAEVSEQIFKDVALDVGAELAEVD